jgi:zinc protease
MTRLELSNGVRALLYPNKAESGQIRVLVRFGKGYQSVTPSNGNLLWAGPYVLPENGIGKLKRTDIDQMVNGRRIELNFAIDHDAFEFAANTRPDDLADQRHRNSEGKVADEVELAHLLDLLDLAIHHFLGESGKHLD